MLLAAATGGAYDAGGRGDGAGTGGGASEGGGDAGLAAGAGDAGVAAGLLLALLLVVVPVMLGNGGGVSAP